jgi:hypothetical protein
MEKVKLSTLSKDTIVLVDGYSNISTISDILEDLEGYKTKNVYTTTEHKANLSAKDMLDSEILSESENNMYEDWDERIWEDVTKKDIDDIQIILDRILSRSLLQNIAYIEDKLIEFDIEEEQMNE